MATEKDDVVLVEHADVNEDKDEASKKKPTTTTTNTPVATVSDDEDNGNDDNNVNTKREPEEKGDDKSNDDTKSETTNANADKPGPVQIVSVGTEEDKFAFEFHEEQLNSVMRKIPPGWKVAVVSVVGAFRTGKSFLLTWFLAYLKELKNNGSTGELIEGDKKWFEKIESIENDAFHWRGGSERNTTGIWMWDHPHFVKKGDESLAILIVDSQGMFDNETTMSLTASIFGLSTLLSSYQIYNVDKRIQEDNLQQLALFSEYARLVVQGTDGASVKKEGAGDMKPFQTMEFLVRDWQHFEDEEDYDQMEQEMNEYMDKVISEREAKDLQETREQILACFEKTTCFGLSHPGMAVIKKNFKGEVSKMDDTFLNLLDRYCRRVFSVENLKPKVIQGREVTAAELGSFIKAYAEMFASGASFPEAATMLEATAAANNSNAVNLAVSMYKDPMDRISGPACSNYIKTKELEEDHRRLLTKALREFDSIATFGSKKLIEEARRSVVDKLDKEFEVYSSLNEGRNPLAGLETYIVPITIATVSYILRGIADLTCSNVSQTCRNTSELLSHIYAVVVMFMLIILATKAQQVKEFLTRMKGALQLVANSGGDTKLKKD
uniref:GB1/RHD3-type G domain-containing protein n=1 Tax=Pseudo-nitzschia australis TaxID=44445 RepID=A0A7S4AA67_9STRA|mmetsp:Transcript_20663/g.44986  ORF Transcript_20663/g.44986 Transcript_20663/m.44986 type:complete len:609 (+) Transcript_20663:129-1955(+)